MPKTKAASAAKTAERSYMTIDHNEIRKWCEERGGRPSIVKSTAGHKGPGILRINFPGFAEESLEEISWDEFFRIFDERKLAFLYQKETHGKESRFFKLINRPPDLK